MTDRRAPLVFVLVAGLACAQPASIEPGKAIPGNLVAGGGEAETDGTGLGNFNNKKAMNHVRKLAKGIGVRVKASSNEKKGAKYIKAKFERFGYRTNVQKFDVAEGTSRNVVAWWPGADKYSFVIGAHMDSVPKSPGANDNASGVAAMLEIARLVADEKPATFIRFVAFGSEEYGTDDTHHNGSTEYVDRLGKKGRRRLGGMLSVDMIADGRPLLIGSSDIADDVVAKTVFNKVDKAGIGAHYTSFCDCSDNGPFEHAGIPAALMWSGDEPDYHSSTDTVANMRSDDLKRTGRAIRAFVRELDQKMIDRFRES